LCRDFESTIDGGNLRRRARGRRQRIIGIFSGQALASLDQYPRLMTKVNTKPLDEAVEQTIDQAIEQTCAEIACSQALSQAEADLVRSIKRLADDHDGSAHEP
jgi:hypothetical protein